MSVNCAAVSRCPERDCRRWKLEQELQQGQLTEAERREVVDLLERRERDFTRLQRQRMSAADFEPLTLIGRGAFGEVLPVPAAVRWLFTLTKPSNGGSLDGNHLGCCHTLATMAAASLCPYRHRHMGRLEMSVVGLLCSFRSSAQRHAGPGLMLQHNIFYR